MNYYRRAAELREETVALRRHLHRHPEVGLELPETVRFVAQTLTEFGLKPTPCGHGLTALLGRGDGPVLLLRADMDALPIQEESGEAFAAQNGAMHACGHDMHTAMLLTAAKLLKETEGELKGQVKLMFQPAEEIFQGAEDMIKDGLLESPAPDAALALHVAIGHAEAGHVYYNADTVMMNSVDTFRLTFRGKASHGGCPEAGVDPINLAVHTHLALQSLLARETPPTAAATLTIGRFSAGSAPNILPDTACMEGTLRVDDEAVRAQLLRRVKEVTEQTAALYRGSGEMEVLSSAPALRCDKALTEELVGYLTEPEGGALQAAAGAKATASEDFAAIARRIPSCYLYLTAGFADGRGDYPVHHPKARFNEEALPLGAAALATCAARYLARRG